MKRLHAFLHGGLWILVFCGLLDVGQTRIRQTMLVSKSVYNWYGLWMRVKGPHNHMVTATGSCVKWPYVLYWVSPILFVSLNGNCELLVWSKCNLIIILSFFVKTSIGQYRFTKMQLSSLTKWNFIQILMIRDNLSLHKWWDVEYIKLKVDELEESWLDNTCELVHKGWH